MWSMLLLATTVTIAPATNGSGTDELPLPPLMLDDPTVVAAMPARPDAAKGVGVPVTPPESRTPPALEPIPAAASGVVPEPVNAPPSIASPPPRELSAGQSWLSTGHLSVGTQLTALNGNPGALASVSGQLQADRWSYGVGVLSGASAGLGMTLVGPRGGVTFLEEGPVDLGASVLFGVGAATLGTQAAALVALQPEFVAQLRLTPWLRASAALAWRFANVWSWAGPPGDALGGPALTLGLEFGRFR